MSRHVSDKVSLLSFSAAQDIPQTLGLHVVVSHNLVEVQDSLRGPLLVGVAGDGRVLLVGQGAVRRGVVGVGTVVAVDCHGTVTLEGVEGVQRRVDGDLLVVDAETVAVGVGVGEEAGLEDGVGGGLDAGDEVGGGEGNLLDLGEVVLGVLVQGELAEGAEWDVLLGPDLGQVEDVPAELLGLLGGEDLDIDGPAWVFTLLDRLEEILGVPVWVLAGELTGLLVVEGLVALVGLEVDLHVVEGAVGLVPLVGVARVAVHVAVRVWGTTVREEVHDLVDSLLVGGEVVPEHGGILKVGLWVALLRVDEERELSWVAQEEDGGVVVDPVPVTLLSVELDGEAAGVASSVCGALLTTNGRETGNSLGLLANSLQHVDDSDIRDWKVD